MISPVLVLAVDSALKETTSFPNWVKMNCDEETAAPASNGTGEEIASDAAELGASLPSELLRTLVGVSLVIGGEGRDCETSFTITSRTSGSKLAKTSSICKASVVSHKDVCVVVSKGSIGVVGERLPGERSVESGLPTALS